MRNAFLLLSLGLFACSGETASTIDSGVPVDSGADQAVNDSGQNKPDTSTGPDGGPSFDASGFDVSIPDANFACQDPSTCNGGFCCADLVLGAGNPPNCGINSISSACKNTCTTKLAFSCSVTETVRFCAKNADCSEVANPKCCHFQQGQQTVTFCASNAVAQFATSCL